MRRAGHDHIAGGELNRVAASQHDIPRVFSRIIYLSLPGPPGTRPQANAMPLLLQMIVRDEIAILIRLMLRLDEDIDLLSDKDRR